MTRERPAVKARQVVDRQRAEGSRADLAVSLEALASALLKEADLHGAAEALEEAGALWSETGDPTRQGNCLLLGASTRRLAGELDLAERNAAEGLKLDLPPRLRRGFETEWCEQQLSRGKYDAAYEGFTRIIEAVEDDLAPARLAQLYQRRAAAAIENEQLESGANDLLFSSTILTREGHHADAEASALAAAAVLAEIDPGTAEKVFSEVSSTVPTDGAAAARRGLVGGKIARMAGRETLALARYDEARQGALDVGDPLSYFTAAVEASHSAESLGDDVVAYGRLATAWGSLTDALGRDAAATTVRPELKALKERLGDERFQAAKEAYEHQRQE